MRMNVEMKLPRLFNRKNMEEPEKEIRLRDVSGNMLIGGTLIIGITVAYTVGFSRGINKGGNIIIMK